MKICIQTLVEQDFHNVFAGFNRELFLALNPPFPPVTLKQFGMAKGDEVHLEINLFGLRMPWVSNITDTGQSEDEIFFVDQGTTLPFFLKRWRHHHRIVRRGRQSLIIDDITYEGRYGLLTYLLYPALYLQFLYRKPVYRRYFSDDNH